MEIWKDIEGFEGLYQVSNEGRVRSLDHYANNHFIEGVMRTPSHTKDGYVKYRLVANGKDVTARVHRLVALAFIPNPENKETVNHIDGNKNNNHVSNLEWMDRHEQLNHAYKLGLKKPVHTNRKLTMEDAEEIRRTYKRQSKEFGTVALANKYGVTDVVIGKIVRNEAYIV